MRECVCAATALSDRELVRRVRNFVLTVESGLAPTLVVTAAGGVVTLRGNADSKAVKWRASQRARRVAGVVRLIDELNVVANSWLSGPDLDVSRPPWMLDYLLNPPNFRSLIYEFHQERPAAATDWHL